MGINRKIKLKTPTIVFFKRKLVVISWIIDKFNRFF